MERLKTSKKTESVKQKKKKSKNSCREIVIRTNTVEDDGTDSLFFV